MPTYFCTKLNRKANVPSHICECGELARCIAPKARRYSCPIHGENKTISLCTCEGCTKSAAVLEKSNRKTRQWNLKGNSTDRPNRAEYLKDKRKYKSRHDDSGLPRHICPNCVLFNEMLLKKVDDLKVALDVDIGALRQMLDRIPDGYPETMLYRTRISELETSFETEKDSILGQRRPISDVCHESIVLKYESAENKIQYISCSDDKGVEVLMKLMSSIGMKFVPSIQHICNRCKDPILKRNFVWETVDRVISGYGDSDYTYLGTSSIDRKVSNEEFVRRQIRYYHLTAQYKDWHSHEPKNQEPTEVETPNSEDELTEPEEPESPEEDIGEI